MRRTPIRIAGACALAATLATSAAACGNDDKKAACDKLQDTISQVSQSGISQNNDPNGLARTYYNSATAIRQEGRDSGDSDVESAANDAASSLEQLSQQLTAMDRGDRGGPQYPTTGTSLMSAGDRIRSACDH
ncbi:hypothetical protein [Actinoallomurus iriomotensis]|uniref:Secreted protein n=1 Tax=Actinoallomurus iriomotensis TaxID=478107 RepID=A0A9W6W195_9ACTN|nr:hypothetical protein [Actinoallomurus iriomotensis]GLY79083.1 hypothetical protein Airi01_073500 [Actinoallomurus iriomotensis]GLY85731.1 hypothetical protein Airi02_036600 [Actinoallomurus iriomotensis]